MASFYDKYLLNNTGSRNSNNIGSRTDVLKKDYTLQYTDYR